MIGLLADQDSLSDMSLVLMNTIYSMQCMCQ